MTTEKRALWVVFKPDKLEDTAVMREKFMGSYPIFKDMSSLVSKCWWCNQEKGEWGALYIFNSEKELQDYITSDLWLNKVPAKYGCTPEMTILEPGPILSKKTITEGQGSWESD
jgi:hypothetical protein